MNEIYIVNGEKYNVSPNRKEEFFKKFPNAELEKLMPGKTDPTIPGAVVEETAAPELSLTELPSVNTSLDSVEISNEEKRKLPYSVSQSLIRDNKLFTKKNVTQAIDILKKVKI